MQTVRIAGRKSKLALVQTQRVIDLLKEKYKDVNFEIVTVLKIILILGEV